jgi:amidase/formamidase
MNIGNLFSLNGKIETEALSVAGIQYAPIGAQSRHELEENVETLLRYMDTAVSAFPGVDLLVFPEACCQGFAPTDFEEGLMEDADPLIAVIRKRCKDLAVWGVFSFLIRTRGARCYENRASIVNDRGEIAYSYAKMNPWIPFENSRPGIECGICDGPKGSRLGIIICSDGDYPEMWREAAVAGANIILRPAHYMDPWRSAWEITNRAGAYFNQVYVVSVNTVGLAKNENRSCFGRSMILGPDGNIITEGSDGAPSLIKADLYPGIIDKMREQSVYGNPMYSYAHRGAAYPEPSGRERGRVAYRAYHSQKNEGKGGSKEA